MDDLLTTQEVADRLRVSVATVNRYARDGLLAHVDLPGERRFREADVSAFLDSLYKLATEKAG